MERRRETRSVNISMSAKLREKPVIDCLQKKKKKGKKGEKKGKKKKGEKREKQDYTENREKCGKVRIAGAEMFRRNATSAFV